VADAIHEEYQGGHMFLFQDRRALPDVRAFLSNNREENQS
jgi:hypothetical protein